MPPSKAKSAQSSAAIALAVLLGGNPARAADILDTLVAAYPQTLSGHIGDTLVFRDGVKLDADGGHPDAPEDWLLTHASIRDQFLIPYPRGELKAPPLNDPGRYRNRAFFDAMYGDCRKGQVEKNLVDLVWMPADWGHTIRVTRINGVADQLRAVSAEIEQLPPQVRRAAYPIEGDYDCRGVADEDQPSMHAYGAAVDLNLHYSEYWLWDAGSNARVPYRNRMPQAIVDIFEHHGFIWGGKWYHYDTMHFEYRPELLR